MQIHKLVILSKRLGVYSYFLDELFNNFKLAADIILLITCMRVLLVCLLFEFNKD
jgi:hypothetical protein